MTTVLVTGGAGYIGSHTTLELLSNNYGVVVVDNLANSSKESLRRVEKLTGKKLKFYKFDLSDKPKLTKVFTDNKIDSVIHFAGLKAVGESVSKPLLYYRNNIVSTLSLLEVMEDKDVRKLVFSSSATVYDLSQKSPLKESAVTGQNIQNPYGQTKYMIEQILKDLSNSNDKWQFSSLRYFNPIGAHSSGEIGEDPEGVPNNLLPYILQVAVGRLKKLQIFGSDYDTPDGTGIRDYIHVTDLAAGHIKALERLEAGFDAINLGTGKGTSVLEMVKTFELATGQKVPYEIVDRRPGDVAANFADVSKAHKKLGWSAQKTVATACKDAWKWQSNNPEGY